MHTSLVLLLSNSLPLKKNQNQQTREDAVCLALGLLSVAASNAPLSAPYNVPPHNSPKAGSSPLIYFLFSSPVLFQVQQPGNQGHKGGKPCRHFCRPDPFRTQNSLQGSSFPSANPIAIFFICSRKKSQLQKACKY